jgi:hypothetical protein
MALGKTGVKTCTVCCLTISSINLPLKSINDLAESQAINIICPVLSI